MLCETYIFEERNAKSIIITCRKQLIDGRSFV